LIRERPQGQHRRQIRRCAGARSDRNG